MGRRMRQRSWWVVAALSGIVRVAVVLAGLLRDPCSSAHARVEAPSAALPLGIDASGPDVLARVGHGAMDPWGLALVVVCVVVGVVINAVAAVIAGIVDVAVVGSSALGAGLAVVGWAPLAAHTAALAAEILARALGAGVAVAGRGSGGCAGRDGGAGVVAAGGPGRVGAFGRVLLWPLPVPGSWVRGGSHRLRRGVVLAEGIDCIERAPRTVLAPVAALVLASVLAVLLCSVGVACGPTRVRGFPGPESADGSVCGGPGRSWSLQSGCLGMVGRVRDRSDQCWCWLAAGAGPE